jgi:hypothetical protein
MMEHDSKNSFNGSPIREYLEEVGKLQTVSEEGKHGKLKRPRERAVISLLPALLPNYLTPVTQVVASLLWGQEPLKSTKGAYSVIFRDSHLNGTIA